MPAALRGAVVGMAALPLEYWCENWPEKAEMAKAGWLAEEEDWHLQVLQWLDFARPGEMIHRHEGVALQVEHRHGDRMLLRNHEEPEYIVVVLTRRPGQILDLNEMD